MAAPIMQWTLALLAAAWVPIGHASLISPDIANALRAHQQALRSAPAPASDVQELPWSHLSPPGWSAQQLLNSLGVNALEDGDPRAKLILDQVQREWQKAPAISAAPKGSVRLTGFAVALAEGQDTVSKVMLVPYYGACIHTPPPANQVVLVTLKQGLPSNMSRLSIWVTGTLRIDPITTRHGRAQYQIADADWAPYPWPKYPIPAYRLPP